MQNGLRVAFIGTGTMGQPMATQILQAGHSLRVHDYTATATEHLVSAGATSFESAAEAAESCDYALLSLPGPVEVREAVAGARGVLSADVPPTTIIDLSTNSPQTVHELRQECADVGIAFIDAPVSGGLVKARTGSLAIMVGAEPDEFAEAAAVLDCIGSDVVHVGPSGSGTVAKLVNNQLFLAAGVLVQEAYVLGASLGMAPSDLHKVISVSSGGTYAKLAPLLMGREFDDVIFRMDIAAKDLSLAAASAEAVDAPVPLTQAAISVYEAALASGDGHRAFHATLLELERQANLELARLERPPHRPEQA